MAMLFYQMARSLDSVADGRFHIAPCLEFLVGKAIAILARPAVAALSKPTAAKASGRNGRFINQNKWPDLWTRAADGRFHIVPCKEFITGQAELFLLRAAKANGRSIRPASCCQSRWPLYQGQWPFYQGFIKEVGYALGHLRTGFRVIMYGASLFACSATFSGSMRAPASPAGHCASPRPPKAVQLGSRRQRSCAS